jgi:diguanylate cyclase (GGDEF)-like protein/PAS domain S-box-containing protein
LEREGRAAVAESSLRRDACVGRALLRSELTATVMIDGDGRVLEFGRGAEVMFGYAREEALGRELAELIVPPALRARHRAGLARCLRGGGGRLLGRCTQQIAMRGDGSTFPVELSILREHDADGPRFVGIIRDISERQRYERDLARSRDLLAQAEEIGGSGSFERDLRSSHVAWSRGLYRILRLPEERPPPSLEQAIELVRADHRERVRAWLRSIAREPPTRFEQRLPIICGDGAERWIELRGAIVCDPTGEAQRLVGVARDVTDELAAQRDRELLSYVVESSEDAIITESPDGLIVSWNQGAEILYGYDRAEAIGQPIGLIVPPALREEKAELMRRVLAGESIQRLETLRLRRDGSVVAVLLTISPVRDSSGEIIGSATVARDVSERRRYEARLLQLAEHDRLTGLLNRQRFERELRRELGRGRAALATGAVLIIDIDSFRAVNDAGGYAAGDALLRRVAHVLRGTLPEEAPLARLGADEFAVLLLDVDADQARAAAVSLLEALKADRFEIDGARFRVTASIGLAPFGAGSARTEELMLNAELAMQAAKRQGRDRVVSLNAEQAAAARAELRLNWGRRIRDALEQERFELHWQPIVDLSTGRPSHGELLLRMREGDRVIGPGQFLSAAEQLGLIHAIDRWALSHAVALLAAGTGPAALPLSVNLSAGSVAGDPQLLGMLEGLLRESGIDPARLILEVTETAAIANMEEARGFVFGCHALGCRLALDDFGTGFASFYYLKHLPADFLKIDREFVHALPHSEVDQRLVGAIVDVARGMGMRTVAEAVADEETLARLRELRVDFAQGFHLGHPQPIPPPVR